MSGNMAASQYEDTILSSSANDETEIFKFYFVKRDSGMTNTLQLAIEVTKERFSDPESIVIMSNEECLKQPKSSLKEKRKYYIFEDFDLKNAAFKYISDVKTVYLLGPRALLSILVEHVRTTSGSYHIHNLSMLATRVTATNLDKEKKLRIKQLVTYMGGYYSNDLEEGCTHLISESVRSVKYEAASVNNVKVMRPNWVEKVWDKSQAGNVAADDVGYDCFRLPCFNGLCFTSTGLTVPAREQLKTAIEENGGKYSASFSQLVDMLIMEDKSIGQSNNSLAKHSFAKRLKITRVNPVWVYDSIKKGYALCIGGYETVDEKPSTTKPNKTSTQTNANATINDFNPDSTMLSDISRVTNFQRNDNIDKAMATAASTSAKSSNPVKQNTLQAAKIAGKILDGFSFYMSGFSVEELRFLGKVLELLGATKVDTLGQQISHVLVNAITDELFQELAKLDNELPIVKVQWIRTMINAKKVVSEDAFLVEQPIRNNVVLEKPLPASKEAMKSLSVTFKKPAMAKPNIDPQHDYHTLNQNLNPSASESSFDNNKTVKLLAGKNVFVYGCSSAEKNMEITGKVKELGATLVDATFAHTVDFVIAPNVTASPFDHGIKKYKHLVNKLWLVESAEAGVICDVLFHHKPLIRYKFGSDELPLANEKFAVTNYKENSRSHIKALIKVLGGECSEDLRKSDKAILISPDAEGEKCQAAKKWSSTILKAEWLVKCYEERSRANEIPFLVGGTEASKKNIDNDDSIVLSSQVVNLSSPRHDLFGLFTESFDDLDLNYEPQPKKCRRKDMIEPIVDTRSLHIDEPASANTERLFPLESEALVEWNYTQQAQVNDSVEPFVFETNGLNVEEKEFVLRELNKLGCETDPDSFTHLITKQPKYGPKPLLAMVSGGFIIHIDYVKKCVEANRLIQLDQFELGNPMFEPTLALAKGNDAAMCKETFKWRKWIREEKKERYNAGAFTGMTFALPEGKPSGTSKLLKRGGGVVEFINFDNPLKISTLKSLNLDYYFCNDTVHLSEHNTQVFKICKILPVTSKSINRFLISK